MFPTLIFLVTVVVWLSLVAVWVAVLLPGNENPIWFVQRFTFSSWMHLSVVGFWVLALGIGLPTIHYVTKRTGVSLIIVRKLYHIEAFLMFVPAVSLVPEFLGLSFGVATALLLFLEYVRACRIPPLGVWLNTFMRSYTDSRDQGDAILTHLYLLVGCALPLWVCRVDDTGLAPYSGILILGAGDAAGAIMGSTYGACGVADKDNNRVGKTRWVGGRKTFFGTFSAMLATIAGAGLIVWCFLPDRTNLETVFIPRLLIVRT